MREYNLPPDVNKEAEKAVGGILTFKQAGWLGGGFLLLMGTAIGVSMLTKSVPMSIICGIVAGVWTVPMAFKKKLDQPLLGYFLLKVKHLRKTHRIINTREVKR